MTNQAAAGTPSDGGSGFVRELGLLDSTMIVAGSMIGSGIFLVSPDIARQVGSPGNLLLVWLVTGVLTIAAALSYGELAAMMPQAGGQYVYLREAYSPLWGFLYGWTLFLVIQTGTIAAVGVGFARYLGVLVPGIGAEEWIVPPIALGEKFAVSLSRQQLVAVLLVVFLTWLNTRGIKLGKRVQTTFTVTKTAALLLLIAVGVIFGRNAEALASNFSDMWRIRDAAPIKPDLSFVPATIATAGAFGLFIAFCVAQVGSLFSSDAWNNITFTAGEVKNPKRNIPLSLAAGTILVISLYVLANVAYMCTLTFQQIQTAPDDRVATAALGHIFGPVGATIMAIGIVISTFGCNNGLILSGARVYYAMAKDGLFFRKIGTLNASHVPAKGLVYQGLWTCLLILPRTRSVGPDGAVSYGNLYGTLLDWVVFAVLIFYVLTVAGIFVLRRKMPEAERPYKAFGYPIVPLLYILAASAIMLVLLFYRPTTSLPGLALVLTGFPVYWLWRRSGSPASGSGRKPA